MLVLFWIILLVAAVPTTAMAQQVVRKYPTTIQVNVDTHGQIVATGVPENVPAALADSVRKTVSNWRFKPG